MVVLVQEMVPSASGASVGTVKVWTVELVMG
jgi:hypothetical protein